MRDSGRRNTRADIVKTAATRTAREWLNASAELMQKPLQKRPLLNQWTNTVLAVVNQDYMGDINIIPPFRFFNPSRILAHLTEEEIFNLIKTGERSTWPKLEMIRMQTMIGRTLQELCADLGIAD